ncbi:hypothetical protein D9M71_46560 [compost metagenome]
MHSALLFVQVHEYSLFDAAAFEWVRQGQVNAQDRRLAGLGRCRQPQLAAQARHDALKLLGFSSMVWRLFDAAGQGHGRLESITAFEHANRAQTCFRVQAILVDRKGSVPLGAAFTVLAQLEQKLAPATFQPGVGAACGVHLVEDQIDIDTRLERLATGMQHQVGFQVFSATQGP